MTRIGRHGADPDDHDGAMDAVPRALEAIQAAGAEALSWLIPVECAGCDAPDVLLCAPCREALAPSAPVLRRIGELDILSALSYEGPVVGVMNALKNRGRTGLARPLGRSLAAALGVVGGIGGAALVPIPTSAASFRRRGYRVVELLARRAGLACTPLLRVQRHSADQRRLGRDERWANTSQLFRASAAPRHPVVLLDDVVTTGATLADAARAVRAAGGEVIGAVTVAATPLRSHGS